MQEFCDVEIKEENICIEVSNFNDNKIDSPKPKKNLKLQKIINVINVKNLLLKRNVI